MSIDQDFLDNLTSRINNEIELQNNLADKKLEDAIESVHPIVLFLFCLSNPKYIKYLPFIKPQPELLYSSP